MDIVRSCYRGLMKFRLGDPALEVRWYFTSPSAEVFREPTPFRSFNYEGDPKENDDLGEQRPGKRPWSNGMRPNGLEGVDFGCGFPRAWWSDGLPPGVHFSLPKTTAGVPFCCLPAIGGVAVSGDADVTVRGPYARPGGVKVAGEAGVDFRILPGGVVVSGDAVVVVHPPVQLCCPGLAGNLNGIVSADAFTCACLHNIPVVFLQVGVEWQSVTIACGGRTLTMRLHCEGVTVNDWQLDIDLSGVFTLNNIPVAGGASCGPLFLAFGPFVVPSVLPPCTGLMVVNIFP